MTQATLAACLLALGIALAFAPPSAAHLGFGTSATKLVQTSTVKTIHYHFLADVPLVGGIPSGVAHVTYEATASEAGHGARTITGSLGGLDLLAATETVNDPLWTHTECAPLDAAITHSFKLFFKFVGNGVVTLPTTSPPDARVAAGTFVVDWPILSPPGSVLGHARVTYQITIQQLPELSLCGPA